MAVFLANCTEEEFQKAVIATARACGWRTVHLRKARRKDGRWETPVQGDGKGFVDVVLYGRGTIVHAELKTEVGVPTPEQVLWREAIEKAGGNYRLWRPADWPAIRAELEANL